MIKKMMFTKDDSAIHYEVIGQGEPLILLHGNSQTSNYFKKQINVFSKKFRLFLLNTRDHGKSSNSQDDLDFHLLVSDLKQLMLIENLKTVNLLGFSDGANIALTFAAKYPKKVNALILASPNLNVEGLKRKQYKRSKLALAVTQALRFNKLSRVLNLAMIDLPISPTELKHITCPVLVIAGSDDIIQHSHFELIQESLPAAELVVAPNTGHSVPRLKPAWFNKQVLNFLKK